MPLTPDSPIFLVGLFRSGLIELLVPAQGLCGLHRTMSQQLRNILLAVPQPELEANSSRVECPWLLHTLRVAYSIRGLPP